MVLENRCLTYKKLISGIDKICIILLAMCPIFQHYKGLFTNAAVTVLLIVFPYALIKLGFMKKYSLKKIAFVSPLIAFFAFKVVDHGTTFTEFGQAVVFSVLVIAIACGCFDTKYFVRVIVFISMTASVCIIIQYICYYVLHFHLQLVPTSLLLPRSDQWVLAAQTGRASITGRATRFYRPSAFFLEPSHMFIYMFTPLILTLLSAGLTKKKRNTAILISVGMLLSTSGMGILMSIGIWLISLGKRERSKTNFSLARLFRPKSIALLSTLAVALVIMYFNVSFFQNSIMRIIGSGDDYTNAISGRVSSGNELVGQLSGLDLVIGIGERLTGIDFNMSGFNATMYQYGIIGTLISYIFFLQGVFNLKKQYFWIGAVLVVLSFFSSHTHSTMFMLYIAFVFVDGYKDKGRQPLLLKRLSNGNKRYIVNVE